MGAAGVLPSAAATASVPKVVSHTSQVPISLAHAGSTGTVYVLSSSCWPSSCLELARTTDLGAHETTTTPPPVSRRDQLPRLFFATPNDGFAIVDTLTGELTVFYATIDGGETWSRSSVGRGQSIVSFTAMPQSYYAVIATCPPRQPCRSYRLARSPVTAVRWTSRGLSNQAGLSQSGAEVAAVGVHVWLSEWTAKDVPLLATSTNRGASFRLEVQPHLGAVTACYLSATSAASLWATCPTGTLVSFLHSTDGGATWQFLPLPLTAGTGGYQFDPVAGDVAYLAHGFNHGVYRMSGVDTVAKVGQLPATQAAGLVFTNARDGLAIGGVGNSGFRLLLLRTTTGGASWRAVP